MQPTSKKRRAKKPEKRSFRLFYLKCRIIAAKIGEETFISHYMGMRCDFVFQLAALRVFVSRWMLYINLVKGGLGF